MIRKLKINKDIYYNTLDFFKKRIVEVCGLILISVFGVFTYSLINYSPNNETLIYKIDEEITGGLFEIYSNMSADFFLQSFGLMSFLFALSVFSWGISLIFNKRIDNFLSKLFYTIAYIIFGCLFVYITNNNSFWLIDNGNSGFVGESSYLLLDGFEHIIDSNLSNAKAGLMASKIEICEACGSSFINTQTICPICGTTIKNTKDILENIPASAATIDIKSENIDL